MTTINSTDVEFVTARSAGEYLQARRLFADYAAQLGVDLCFQNFSVELEQLPQMYGPSSGRLILARAGDEYVGCIGVRALAGDSRACEMKRLYVSEPARGLGIGRKLAVAAIEAARELGYERMVLDTLANMTAARALYVELGFRKIVPYYSNPNDGVTYLELSL